MHAALDGEQLPIGGRDRVPLTRRQLIDEQLELIDSLGGALNGLRGGGNGRNEGSHLGDPASIVVLERLWSDSYQTRWRQRNSDAWQRAPPLEPRPSGSGAVE